ncbi:MAG: saccharopine dehydrogenase NADP-binding domain-containing protein, partial [Bacteroidia bacterium]|nr:saccharopine dehydrogenase NADP-binding domain-containing protein [Bacteroidia bacterium]
MFSPSVLVLGAGRVGRAIALDLSRRYKVTVADRDERALSILRQEAPSLTFITVDFTQRRSLIEAAAPFTLVISAVPGSIGFTVVDALIQARKNVVDISFFPEDPFLLEEQAVKHGVTVVVDCGVAPG